MDVDSAANDVRYPAWWTARLAAIAGVSMGVLSVPGTRMIVGLGQTPQLRAMFPAAAAYAVSQTAAALAVFLVLRGRGALELTRRRLRWMAAANGAGLAVAVGCPATASAAESIAPATLVVLALGPALPRLVGLALSGVTLLIFRRVWREAVDDLRRAEIE